MGHKFSARVKASRQGGGLFLYGSLMPEREIEILNFDPPH